MTANVFKLDGTSNIKMGSWGDELAIFIRPMFPLDQVNHSHEFRHASHANDLSENEFVIVVENRELMQNLYMTLRTPPAQITDGFNGDFSKHRHPSVHGRATTTKPELNYLSEPAIQFARKELTPKEDVIPTENRTESPDLKPDLLGPIATIRKRALDEQRAEQEKAHSAMVETVDVTEVVHTAIDKIKDLTERFPERRDHFFKAYLGNRKFSNDIADLWVEKSREELHRRGYGAEIDVRVTSFSNVGDPHFHGSEDDRETKYIEFFLK